MLEQGQPVVVGIAEVIVRDKQPVGEVVLVAVNLVVNYYTIPYVSVSGGPHQEVQVFDLVALLV